MKTPNTSVKANYLVGITLACLFLFSITTVQAQDVTTTTDTSFVVKGNLSDETGPLPPAVRRVHRSDVGHHVRRPVVPEDAREGSRTGGLNPGGCARINKCARESL